LGLNPVPSSEARPTGLAGQGHRVVLLGPNGGGPEAGFAITGTGTDITARGC
jgi:hypothetical protein